MPGIARCQIFINGIEYTNLRNYKSNKVDYSKEIKLMNSTDYLDMQPMYGFQFSTMPKSGVRGTNWDTLIDGTAKVSVPLKNGKTVNYSGCRCISVEESEINGETEISETIIVYAKNKKETL